MKYTIEAMNPGDWQPVRSIYLEGISPGNATFETEAPEWPQWDAKHFPVCRLVARDGSNVLGWAALSPVSTRRVYAGVAEVSIYVGEKYRGYGIGRALLEALIASSEEHGIWMLQAGIFPENRASVELHETCGFQMVGRRERIGQMNGVWRDIVLLERRSKIVGVS